MLKRFILLTFLATPALAEDPFAYDACDELWFMRNQIFDNAGYCFASPLGQTVFDNSDCTPGAVTLSSFHAALIESFRMDEARAGCAVDTSVVRPLRVPYLEDRRETPWLGSEWSYSGCIGFTGPAFSLFQDPTPAAAITAQARAGDNLAVIVTTQTGGVTWHYYYLTDDNGTLTGEGWADHGIDWSACTSSAG